MRKTKHVLAVALLATAVSQVQAAVNNAQSYYEVGGVRTGNSQYLGTTTMAGIGVDGQLGNQRYTFSHFTVMGYGNSYGVHDFTGRQIVADNKATPSYGGLGVWAFKQVGNLDVWFGEWDKEGSTIGSKVAGTHTAYYSGQKGDVTSTMPTTTATYTIQTIGNYVADTALPTSTLTATFGTTNMVSSTGDINFPEAAINMSLAKFVAMDATVISTGGTGGAVIGDFFGTGAAGVAGVVKFPSERDKDVSFGGMKND